MINGDMVVAQTLQGATPPTWRVLRARAAYFYSQIGLAVFLLAIGVGGFLYLTDNPNVAEGYGIGGLQPASVIDTWRTIDFVVLALVVFSSIYLLVKNVIDMTHAKEQVLVLMPEGFVVNSDKRAAYAYGAMRTLSATINRGTLNIKVVPADGAKAYRIAIDARFDNVKQVAQMITTARNQFAAAQVAAQQPQPQPMAQYPDPQR